MLYCLYLGEIKVYDVVYSKCIENTATCINSLHLKHYLRVCEK